MPLPTRLRSSTLERKRGEYQSLVDLTFAKGKDGLDQQIWHQIEIDVPRTRPGVPLWMHSSTQRVCIASHPLPTAIALTTPIYFLSQCLERILYVWAIRHPASGYVQGINDLATPFFEVFLSAYLGKCWYPPATITRSVVSDDQRTQMPIPKKSTLRSFPPPSSPPSRLIRSGASRVCSTGSKTTTSPRNRASSAASSAWRSSSRASTRRSPSTSPRRASSLCNSRSGG